MTKTISEIDEYCRLHNKVLTERPKGLWVVTDTVKEGNRLFKDDYRVKNMKKKEKEKKNYWDDDNLIPYGEIA